MTRSKPAQLSVVERFKQGMAMDQEKWREGASYDLSMIASASPEERVALEQFMAPRSIDDWRDVEALAAIDTPRTRELLRAALKHSNHQIRTAVTRYAPELISGNERSAALVATVESAGIQGGLTQALTEITQYHPPEVIDALFRATLSRTDNNGVHLAAMLMYLHGKADSEFDWSQRPFFLRFGNPDRAAREAAFLELCDKVGVDPQKYLPRSTPAVNGE